MDNTLSEETKQNLGIRESEVDRLVLGKILFSGTKYRDKFDMDNLL